MERRYLKLRFYAELNDFLPIVKRQTEFLYYFQGNPAIKDIIESVGVPHIEVDLILVNQQSVDFKFQPSNDDHVAVYPVFEAMDIEPIYHLRAKPLRDIKFVVDVNLGKLARYLRMLGFDTFYHNHLSDKEIIEISLQQHRIILTRDIGILKNNRITHGYWLRNTNKELQTREVVQHLQLQGLVKPFNRCLECNNLIRPINKEEILDKLPQRTRDYFQTFFYCDYCDKVFWEGTHVDKMRQLIQKLVG